ncbi:hypothetical protein NMA58_19635 [Rhizobium sp. YTUHZ045]|uniref:hypothetical protein n=1 Tax=Rhizobium sp. YTUHZ045 TaxID=2962888 RepID=UPI003DAA3292
MTTPPDMAVNEGESRAVGDSSLIRSGFDRDVNFGGFSLGKRRTPDLGQGHKIQTGESPAIQHLVGKSDSKSILSREQKLNQQESAIRL